MNQVAPQHRIPQGWNQTAHHYWLNNQKSHAIETIVTHLNTLQTSRRPADLYLQFGYYLYLIKDYHAAMQVFLSAQKQYPQHLEILKNLATTAVFSKNHTIAIQACLQYLTHKSHDYSIYDILAGSYWEIQKFAEAAQAGTKSLALKDQQHQTSLLNVPLPSQTASSFLAHRPQKNVIAFSLWGNHPRYLHGAIDNAQARAYMYPNWHMRVYLDQSVPQKTIHALEKLGCEIVYENAHASLREKLCWRFQVANDPNVGRFLVRDIDSTLNIRERLAVDEWLRSECYFHVMRDWWTHSDLILAGMWGGVAGVLPELKPLLQCYTPNAVETPNIDQWFLRDQVWALIRPSVYVHDRYFKSFNATAWPIPHHIKMHVGQNEYAVAPQLQQQRIQAWLN